MVCGPTDNAVQKKRAYEKSMQAFLDKIKSVQYIFNTVEKRLMNFLLAQKNEAV